MAAADRIEYEPWMLQAGSELWRRILAVLPRGHSLPHVLMHMARLDSEALEALMTAVVEVPDRARELFGDFGGDLG